MKQTAVEWLQDTWLNYPDLCSYDKIQEWFEQAKEMEKEIIKKEREEAYKNGYANGQMDAFTK
jgi:flagellar biosynthesis/type III secretory pathway protein FliH